MKERQGTTLSLGIDIGALAVKAAFLAPDGGVRSFYRFHKGHPEQAIIGMMGEIGCAAGAVATTGSGGRRIAKLLDLRYVDPAVSLIAAAGDAEGIRHIIDIGGGSLSIVDLDEKGRFAGFRTNSLCAAGTGSFLDEQAARMQLSLSEMSKERDIAEPPRIAARCAVFAKSDLIHRQQEGFSIPEMWSGLCKGMVSTALSTLFRGRRPSGRVLLAGGVALNKEVLRWLAGEIETTLIVPCDPETLSARGAMLSARKIDNPIDWKTLLSADEEKSEPRRAELRISRSPYPSFECKRSFVDDDTEVRIHGEISGDVVIGFDVGSTSTKAAVLSRDGEALADFYRRTSGDPIGATQKLFAALLRASAGSPFTIVGTGTTGSGRKMIGSIIGADRVINEITAHVSGSVATDPDVETIFEIGGQDAKFIALREGAPHDSNMNYVCAAGTGSFVEEQAGKLGFKLTEIGDSVMGTCPPYSTDRCTVFMEQDVHALIRDGYGRNEVMGSVLYSVVQNYLNRVVGRRPFSKKKICFMGATARNKGLVAAFENLLDAPIVVSPYCHVMGAFGVARIVLDAVVDKNIPTSFVGVDVVRSSVTLERGTCELCANRCSITHALLGANADKDNAPSWGYLCGRDPDEMCVRVSHRFEPFRRREKLWRTSGEVKWLPKDAPAIAMPRALLTYSYLPFWRKFFGELGMRLVLSKPTSSTTLSRAEDYIGSDYCYPVKLAHGHVRELAEEGDAKFIFLPHIVQGEPHDDGFKRSVFCPYNIAFPSIARVAGLALAPDGAGLAGADGKSIISPALNYQLAVSTLARELKAHLSPIKSLDEGSIERAWQAAVGEQANYIKGLVRLGDEYLKKLEDEDESGVVILGRPYNVCDFGSNLNIPQKIADLNFTVLLADMLPLSDVRVDDLYKNMYWQYGRKILQAARFIASHPRLYAVLLTNFGCGPDSFLQTYVERIMRGKPMLMLELDEHSADAGYITRLEAFRDVIQNKRKAQTPSMRCSFKGVDAGIDARYSALGTRKSNPSIQIPASSFDTSFDNTKRASSGKVRTLWIPPMHPYATPMLAAAMRSTGLPARPLPTETLETFEIAKRYCRGTECVPAPSTIGAFLGILKNSDAPHRECLFMPTAKGPCRFGQYSTLHRIILDEAGFADARIESWDDGSGDFGLSMKACRRMYNSIVAADLLYKARCRIRPYAVDRDRFDTIMDGLVRRTISIIEAGGDLPEALRDASHRLSGIEVEKTPKPLVGIVGEIYVRSNVFTNGSLIETVEDSGGEAWLSTTGEWFQYLSSMDKYFSQLKRENLRTRLKKTLKRTYMLMKDRELSRCMSGILSDRPEPSIESTIRSGERVFPRQFDGESILTVGRAMEFAEFGVDLIINCAPFGCMPGTLTSGIFQGLEGKLGVPVISLFFDGETDLKHLVRTYLANLKMESGEKFRGAHGS